MLTFFFSYSRNSNDPFLQQFFGDLKKAVDDRAGVDDSGYIDQAQNEPGDFWTDKLERALGEARVFVAAVTANYCRKTYCRKEWAAFEGRLRQYAAARGLPALPPLMLPLIWVPPDDADQLPDAVRERHFHIGDPAAAINRRGLEHVVRLSGSVYASDYVDALDVLARRILKLAREHAAIDDHAQIPPLAAVAPAFGGDAPPQPGGTAEPGGGPRCVHFVYGAPAPAELQPLGRQRLHQYGPAGGADWKPFFPSDRTVAAIAQNIASSPAVNMYANELKLDADLASRIRALEQQRQLVVMLLDRWAARVPRHAAALRSFDDQNYVNCSVLLPENPADDESVQNAPQLLSGLRQALRHRIQSGNRLLLRAGITDEATFRTELEDLLIRLRNEVIAESLPTGPVPDSAERPAVSATSH